MPVTELSARRAASRRGGVSSLWRSKLFLAVTLGTLAAGIGARLAGATDTANHLWSAGTALGLAITAWWVLLSLLRRQVGVDLIAVIALAGTLAVHEYAAGAVIAVMVATGRLLETYASARAEHDLRHLLEHAPQTVHRYDLDGVTSPPLEAIRPGDRLLVKAGEIVPVDGRLDSESALLDLSSITGEALPVSASRNDIVASGAVNAGPPFDLRAISAASDSTFAGIVRLVERAMDKRAPFVRMADRFAAWFVPFTLLLAGAAWLASGHASRAVAVVVVATPCPLLLAAPIAIVSGLSRAAREGVIVKDGGVLEQLASARVVVLDKTGTVTRGYPVVSDVICAPGIDADALLGLTASLEQTSAHVLASAVVRAATEQQLPVVWPDWATESLASGITGEIHHHRVRAGKLSWLEPGPAAPWVRAVRRRLTLDGSLSIFVEIDGVLAGAILLDDPIRPDAARSIRALRAAGVARVVLATGDRESVAGAVGAALGVDEVLAERTPEEKVIAIELERPRGTTVMVGDGVNDAPALAAADVGVALSGRGASASSDAADVVLTVDRIERLVATLQIARRSHRVARQSVISGMALSVAAMCVASIGLLPALWGAIVQEAIDALVIMNALRVLLPTPTGHRLTGEDAALAQRLVDEHRRLDRRLRDLRLVAAELATAAPDVARARLLEVDKFLQTDLLDHEHLEESRLYPAVSRVLGDLSSTGTMSRSHAEIDHLATLFHTLVSELGESGPDADDTVELQRILYGLDAVLRLHNAQEEQEYLSLAPEPPRPRDTSPGRSQSGHADPALNKPARSQSPRTE